MNLGVVGSAVIMPSRPYLRTKSMMMGLLSSFGSLPISFRPAFKASSTSCSMTSMVLYSVKVAPGAG